MTDRIEKTVELNAPIERVWRALTDHSEFGAWFKVRLDQPFVRGGRSTGNITEPGYEHLKWEARVLEMDEPRLFAFAWRPDFDAATGELGELETRVEFRLEPSGQGTRLVVSEAGFDALPPGKRELVMRRNDGGWAEQTRRIKAHVE